MQINGKKRIAFVATTTAAVLIGGGIAAAYWTTSGTGTGTAGVGSAQSVTVSPDSTPSGLYPGGPSQALDYSINNPGPGVVWVSNVVVSITGTNKVGCTAADFTLTQPTVTPGNVAVGTTSYLGASTGAAIAMKNTASNQNACQNATVNLLYTVS